MKTPILALLFVASFSTHVYALDITCVDRTIQDSQLTARFQSGPDDSIQVTLSIPDGETSAVNATGACVPEEDTFELSLRCEEVVTASGAKYFARIDGRTATIAKDGKILSQIPCDEDAESTGK